MMKCCIYCLDGSDQCGVSELGFLHAWFGMLVLWKINLSVISLVPSDREPISVVILIKCWVSPT